ncbi:MAG: C1 family peptidase [Gemmatimonadetes bacterium]|nr:C1 family peptidase [Gemmatimonadota bacterium]
MPTSRRVVNVRRDTVDFRDLMFVPTLTEVPELRTVEEYAALYAPSRKGTGKSARGGVVPILDQGQEGACTGFGLAAVANFLLHTRRVWPDPTPVSAEMLYTYARRYDEWPGEDYEGSSARGAMKAWHKHGIVSEERWQLAKNRSSSLDRNDLDDALKRPLGAYFRVNHRDLVAMHCALAEVGIIYVTSDVTAAWDAVGADGRIAPGAKSVGGHAFAIVGYDRDGFWLQNSWGPSWGKGGFAHLSYEDWLQLGNDAWVARLGAPVSLAAAGAAPAGRGVGGAASLSLSQLNDLRPHVVSLDNHGRLRETGDIGNTKADVERLLREDLPRITQAWGQKRLLLYAHGGLVGEDGARQRVMDYRDQMLPKEVYPLAFIWHSDIWSTLKNIIEDAVQSRRAGGVLGDTKDFLLDRLDDSLEVFLRAPGKLMWDNMKGNATGASDPWKNSAAGGGASLVANVLAAMPASKRPKVHIACHSAGAILMAGMVKTLYKLGVQIESCSLWAPACTVELFWKSYAPVINGGGIRRFAVYTLTDQAEQDDDCARVYNKSLLYLVSHAFEEVARIPLLRPDGTPQFRSDGTPLLGMQRGIDGDVELKGRLRSAPCEWILAPDAGVNARSHASHHGDFDDDPATVADTLSRILADGDVSSMASLARRGGMADALRFRHTRQGLADRRRRVLGE